MNKKNRYSLYIICILLFYLVLLILLTVFEKNTGSGINTLRDAVWYMLVTMATVGYGDKVPLSAGGRFIGILFILSSAGVFVIMIRFLMSWMSGSLIPRLVMCVKRSAPWYIFSDLAPDTIALANNIEEDDKQALFIFKRDGETDQNLLAEVRVRHLIMTDYPYEYLTGFHRGSSMCTLFLMYQDGWRNYEIAQSLKTGEHFKIFCRTDYVMDKTERGKVMFNERDSLARFYWLTYPVSQTEQSIVLIGSGSYAEKLVERGLLINVLPKTQVLTYHVFGSLPGFIKNHPEIQKSVPFNEHIKEKDAIFFYDENWQDRSDILDTADRIVFCDEDVDVNLEEYNAMKQYFHFNSPKHILYPHRVEGAASFGVREDIYKKSMIMNQGLNTLAYQVNEIYRRKYGGKALEELTEFQRQSNIAAADHLITKIRILLPDEEIRQITPEICKRAFARFAEASPDEREAYRALEHERWMRFYLMYNWKYAPVRDDEKREHNLLVPYGELSELDQSKDDSAWELLNEDLF